MDFQLNDEQLQLKKSVREFAEREIAPHVMKWDEAGEFPLETIKELGKLIKGEQMLQGQTEAGVDLGAAEEIVDAGPQLAEAEPATA